MNPARRNRFSSRANAAFTLCIFGTCALLCLAAETFAVEENAAPTNTEIDAFIIGESAPPKVAGSDALVNDARGNEAQNGNAQIAVVDGASSPSPTGAPVGAASTVAAPTVTEPIVADPAQLRGSLSVRAAPMSQVFTLLGAMTPLRFRYVTPPDAVLTAEWKDALLLSSLHDVLQKARWSMHRENLDVFVYRMRPSKTDVRATNPVARVTDHVPHVWQYWSAPTPPPRRWMTVAAIPAPAIPTRAVLAAKKPSGKPAPKNAKNSSPGTGENRIVVRWRSEQTGANSTSWRDAEPGLDATQRPGVGVFVPLQGSPQPAGTAPKPATSPVWLRWRLTLGFVPRGARLLLDLPAAATLHVNGAPLLSRRSGINVVDLNRLLVRGENYLALHFPAAATDASRPLFRYEWLFETDFNGTIADAS